MYEITGVLNEQELKACKPSDEILSRGAVAVIECIQLIPCNPCVDACKRGAISVGDDINNPPVIDYTKCNGCSLCLRVCPGLAIFIVDSTYSETEAKVMLRYEFLPLPEENTIVLGLNREGKGICDARVIKVEKDKKYPRTAIVSLAVPKEFALDVRHLKIQSNYHGAMQMDNDTIICRCEDITYGEIVELIDQGYTTLPELNRLLRVGMGPCQSRTCSRLIAQIISQKTGKPVSEIEPLHRRPPVIPVRFSILQGDDHEE